MGGQGREPTVVGLLAGGAHPVGLVSRPVLRGEVVLQEEQCAAQVSLKRYNDIFTVVPVKQSIGCCGVALMLNNN